MADEFLLVQVQPGALRIWMEYNTGNGVIRTESEVGTRVQMESFLLKLGELLGHEAEYVDGNVRFRVPEVLSTEDQCCKFLVKQGYAVRKMSQRERDDTWSEHPKYPRSWWNQEAGNDDTHIGYWDWVESQIEQNGEEEEEEDPTWQPPARPGYNMGVPSDMLPDSYGL